MNILPPALAVAFAALCIWLAVRIINRRERWAKWTLAAIVGLPVLYVLSFGPACWISSRTNSGTELLPSCYRPIVSGLTLHETRLSAAIQWYSQLGAASGWRWAPDGIAISDDHWISLEWVWMRYPL
jgi:hypothetical protein